jgi:hypothetical protein
VSRYYRLMTECTYAEREQAKIHHEIQRYLATLPRRQRKRDRQAERAAPVPTCAECWAVGLANCGEHGLLRARRELEAQA